MILKAISNSISGAENSTQGVVDVLGRLQTGSFFEQLRPASWRGIPFAVLGADTRVGRRNAVHEYPGRDDPWVEDLGRAAREFEFRAFLVGDDVIAQRERLMRAVESGGDGSLVHPTLGVRKVALLEFSCEERWDKGRYFEISFTFMEQGKRRFPTEIQSTGSGVGSASNRLNISSARAFLTRILGPLQSGAQVVNQVVGTAAAWSKAAQDTVKDATSLLNLVNSLPGSFGRLPGGSPGVLSKPGATVASLIGVAAASRKSVSTASSVLNESAAGLSSSTAIDFASLAQSLGSAVADAIDHPFDALRALSRLASYAPKTLVDASSNGLAMSTALSASGDLYRRASLAALASASAAYVPESSDQAIAARSIVLDAFDSEILIAGNQGEDQVYADLKALRAACALDLNSRGANLPNMVEVSSSSPVPSLVLAQRQYRDSSRADELVSEANPIHPAFMPTQFLALSS